MKCWRSSGPSTGKTCCEFYIVLFLISYFLFRFCLGGSGGGGGLMDLLGGGGGTFIALLAWLIIGIAVFLDKPVKDLFFWLAPFINWIRKWLNKPIASQPALNPDSVSPVGTMSTEDFTPIDPSAMPSHQKQYLSILLIH